MNTITPEIALTVLMCLAVYCAGVRLYSRALRRRIRDLEVQQEHEFLKPLLNAEYEAAIKAMSEGRLKDFRRHKKAHDVLFHRYLREVIDKSTTTP